MESTQYFTITIDDGQDSENMQGAYCSYCGKKIIPTPTDTGGFVFVCNCELAQQEESLRKDLVQAHYTLNAFLEEQEEKVKVSEIETRIRISEIHTESLKKALGELTNPKSE